MQKRNLPKFILPLLFFTIVALKINEGKGINTLVKESDPYSQLNNFMRDTLGEDFPPIDQIGNYIISLNFVNNENSEINVRISITSRGINTTPETKEILSMADLNLISFSAIRFDKLDLNELSLLGLSEVAENCGILEPLNYSIRFSNDFTENGLNVSASVESAKGTIETIFTDPSLCFPEDFIKVYETYFSRGILPEWLVENFGRPVLEHEDEFNINSF